jgi:hypothetical protein
MQFWPIEIFKLAHAHLIRFECFILFSIVISLALLVRGRPDARWFFLMTLVWAIINAGVAALFGFHIHIPNSTEISFSFNHIIKWMTLNLALDICYGLFAIWLFKKPAKENYQPMLSGFGKAILLQSFGLFIIDGFFLIRMIGLHTAFLNQGSG